jgi:hypothetical protein
MTDRHALGFDTDVDLGHHPPFGRVNDGRNRVVLVGDVEVAAVRIEVEELGVGTRG